MTMEKYETLGENVQRLRRNLEQYPLEVLTTKYAKGYQRITAQIRRDATDCAMEIFMCPKYPESDYDKTGNQMLRDKRAGIIDEILPQCINVLVERQELSEYYDLLEKAVQRIRREAFEPFWARHCIKFADGVIFNDIWCLYWNPGGDGRHAGWYGANGVFNPFYLPPENPLTYEKWRELYKKSVTMKTA